MRQPRLLPLAAPALKTWMRNIMQAADRQNQGFIVPKRAMSLLFAANLKKVADPGSNGVATNSRKTISKAKSDICSTLCALVSSNVRGSGQLAPINERGLFAASRNDRGSTVGDSAQDAVLSIVDVQKIIVQNLVGPGSDANPGVRQLFARYTSEARSSVSRQEP
jgi:hypothetical protein